MRSTKSNSKSRGLKIGFSRTEQSEASLSALSQQIANLENQPQQQITQDQQHIAQLQSQIQTQQQQTASTSQQQQIKSLQQQLQTYQQQLQTSQNQLWPLQGYQQQAASLLSQDQALPARQFAADQALSLQQSQQQSQVQAQLAALPASQAAQTLQNTQQQTQATQQQAQQQAQQMQRARIAQVPNSNDGYGHGTHVAGIIAGDGNHSTGGNSIYTYKGIAPGVNLIDLQGARLRLVPARTARSFRPFREAIALKRTSTTSKSSTFRMGGRI